MPPKKLVLQKTDGGPGFYYKPLIWQKKHQIKFCNNNRKNFIDEIQKIKKRIPAGTDYDPIHKLKVSHRVEVMGQTKKHKPHGSYLSEALYLG